MDLPNIFTKEVSQQFIDRINTLQNSTPAKWGKMNIAQMLAHCSVTYEMIYTDKHPKPNFLLGLMLKSFVKKHVVNDQPYKPNLRTAPAFIIADEKDFENEKKGLIEYIEKTQSLGENAFNGKESLSFGKLTSNEWNNMFYKHLDHHLKQFGA